MTVEMSEDFEPGERTAAALAELVAALEEEHGDGDEVSGFTFQPVGSFSFTYDGTLDPDTGSHKIPGRLKWENITLKRGST